MGRGAVKRIQAQSRFALTGTPMENHPGELWSIFDFVLPGYLMDQADFMQRYGDGADSDLLARKIRPFLMRRLKREVLSELPEKIEHRIVAELTPEQKTVYLATLAQVKKRTGRYRAQRRLGQSAFPDAGSHHPSAPDLLPSGAVSGGLRGRQRQVELLMELVGEQVESGHRILIFSQSLRCWALSATT